MKVKELKEQLDIASGNDDSREVHVEAGKEEYKKVKWTYSNDSHFVVIVASN